MQGKSIKFFRQREYYMKVRYRQELLFPCLYPLFPFVALAFRAMPVSAAVVADAHIAA
ncbi:hypothetical protein MYP_4633 [Sporocytophaga myxococcoides]|uniref:Uncharacterized protein n=1 Tax=Sporocytophaga myxococcoides TaxID=153721 RepID=A0A098LMR3_9BACT|nr:hypothetical protein MYP_4633 [Sporocytophaga myxococcoides]